MSSETRAPEPPGAGAPAADAALTPADREALREIAVEAVRRAVAKRDPAETAGAGSLAAMRGVFVSIYVGGRLRGCLGRPRPERALAETVAEMAAAAAIEDDRFEPVAPDEIPRLRVEISVLSEPTPVSGPDEIVVGRDGVVVEAGDRVGLLLPQVATRCRLSAAAFLAEAARKAGLPPDGWRRAAVARFTAEAF